MKARLTELEAARLRKPLGAKLAGEARKRGVTADLVRKQYIFTIFLSRIFQHEDTPWVLLGGNALLIRTGGGRFTQDIDLARSTAWASAKDAESELQQLASQPFNGDPFEFKLQSLTVHREQTPDGYGAETVNVKAQALLGGQVFETFSLDLTTQRHLDTPVDHLALKPIIEHSTLQDLPQVPTAPIENHLADKICALYELHGPQGATPSTRYRDLADIVRIVLEVPFDAPRLVTILAREAGRRQMTLPDSMKSPGGGWSTGFPAAAAGFAEYPDDYRLLDDALQLCGACLDDVLSGTRTNGTWDPGTRSWL